MKSNPLTPTARLAAIAKIIERNQTMYGMATIFPKGPDGRIYKLAKGAKRAKRK